MIADVFFMSCFVVLEQLMGAFVRSFCHPKNMTLGIQLPPEKVGTGVILEG